MLPGKVWHMFFINFQNLFKKSNMVVFCFKNIQKSKHKR